MLETGGTHSFRTSLAPSMLQSERQSKNCSESITYVPGNSPFLPKTEDRRHTSLPIMEAKDGSQEWKSDELANPHRWQTGQ